MSGLNRKKETARSKIDVAILIGEQFQDIKDTLGTLMEDVTIIKTDVSFLKSAVKRKVDAEEFEALEKRVALLEAKSRK